MLCKAPESLRAIGSQRLVSANGATKIRAFSSRRLLKARARSPSEATWGAARAAAPGPRRHSGHRRPDPPALSASCLLAPRIANRQALAAPHRSSKCVTTAIARGFLAEQVERALAGKDSHLAMSRARSGSGAASCIHARAGMRRSPLVAPVVRKQKPATAPLASTWWLLCSASGDVIDGDQAIAIVA